VGKFKRDVQMRVLSVVRVGSAFFVRRLCARIENINVATRTINSGVCRQFGRVTAMKINLRIITLFAMLAILLPNFTLLASETATISDLAGQWHGKSRFTGISYEEATKKTIAPQDIETMLHISADGKVTGQIGGAELTNCVVTVNRGWFGRRLHLWSDFIIRGKIIGAVAPGSESGTHRINAPFNSDSARIDGSVFVVYPVKYPYPFFSLQLSR
jgi:hypothetical protein